MVWRRCKLLRWTKKWGKLQEIQRKWGSIKRRAFGFKVYTFCPKKWKGGNSIYFMLIICISKYLWTRKWPWSYGSWIYNYLCLSPLMWVRLPCPTLCDKVCQWLAASRWFSPCLLVSSSNKTDLHDITEKLFKVAFNTIKPTYNH